MRLLRRTRPRVGFLVLNLDGMGGTSRAVINQANALTRRGNVDVRLISVTRTAERPHYDIDTGIAVDHLADVRETDDVPPSRLVPAAWDAQFSAMTDAAVRAELPRIDVDILVTVTPALMSLAVQLAAPGTRVLHQEHRSSADRQGGLEPLLAFAPRVDAVALLTDTMRDWLADRLGRTSPWLLTMPNPLPLAHQPRSPLDTRTIVAAGRIVQEKQLMHVMRAFEAVADDHPGWQLRILGDGPIRPELVAHAAKVGLADRIELPGAVEDMSAEWARASVCVLSSRTEGFPLVAQEAMSAGVPVVSYDCPSGPRELVEDEVSGLLVGAGSKAGLAVALDRVMGDDALRHRLGAGALEASHLYDADAIAARWEEVFESLRRNDLPPPEPPRPFNRQQGPLAALTPPESRAQVAALLHEALSSAAPDGGWFAMPVDGQARLVVPTRVRRALLDHLVEQAPDHLSLLDPGLHGWPERRDTVRRMRDLLRNAAPTQLVLEPWPRHAGRRSPLAEGAGVTLEFWDTRADGVLVAPGPNPWTREVAPDALTATLDVAGSAFATLPAMTRPTVTDVRFPIDVVYTWVDDDDPVWQATRDARTGADSRRESSGDARFRNRDELRHSMRSIHAHAPWVRTIHLVTAGQRPDWLADHPRVRLVDHRDILPADALPTFNSQAIETALHRVPGLSEHFVYLNDDMFLARPLSPERFFDAGGSSAVFLGDGTIGQAGESDRPYLLAAHNNRRLLEESLGVTITRVLAHAPYAHRVSVLAEVEARFAEAVAATARAPFRSPTDVSMLSSLAQHYGLATGTAHVGEGTHSFVDLTNARVERALRKLRARDVDFICIGDHHDFAVDTAAVDALLAEFLAGYFPVAAPWER